MRIRTKSKYRENPGFRTDTEIELAQSHCVEGVGLTHLPLDYMVSNLADDILKCIFLNENDGISIQISLKFVPRSPIANKAGIDSGNGLAPNKRQAVTWTNDDPVHWRIYVALGRDELTPCRLGDMGANLKIHVSILSPALLISAYYECHRTLLMITQQWFRQWLGPSGNMPYTWTNVGPNLCHNMASQGHNDYNQPTHPTSQLAIVTRPRKLI